MSNALLRLEQAGFFSTGTTVTAQSQLSRFDDRFSPIIDLRRDADLSLSVRQSLLQGGALM
ncbi:MAG: hypothetical protein LR015_12145 [Verrucomicrobia bacterium]|nr:hypothetical protein [Verrucomicrobiota bacterium]